MKSHEKQLAVDQFGAAWASLLDEVAEGGATLVLTRDGHPVAKVSPVELEEPDERDRTPVDPEETKLRGSVLRYGDIVSPIDEPWDADR